MRRTIPPPSMRGFTLIELLVVLALLAVLATLSAPSFLALRTNQRLASQANDLYASLLHARSEALRLNRRVTVAPLQASNWLAGWRVYVDLNNNGVFDAATEREVGVTLPDEAGFSASGENNGAQPTAFSFDASGFLVTGFGNRVVLKSAATNREKQVIVNATGRARLCDPKLKPGCELAR